MISQRITYTSHPGTTPEQARDTRARAWRFVLDCYAKKKAVTSEEKAGVSTGPLEREEGDCQ